MGWELPLDAICIDGSFAQKVYFAKSHERSFPAIHSLIGMLRCGPSKEAFAAGPQLPRQRIHGSRTKLLSNNDIDMDN
jgi:hypothetical protein